MMAVDQLPALSLPTDALSRCRPVGGELRAARRRLGAKAIAIALVTITSYLTLVFVANGLLVALPAAVLLVVGLVATSTGVMHDANHGAFGHRSLNRTLAFSADLLGASSWLWRQKHHVLHHGNTNVVGVDTDIEQMPFARLAPSQPWRPWYRYQHVYLWFLYGFLTLQWLLFSDFASLATGRIGTQPIGRKPRRSDLVGLFAGKALHVGWAIVLPMMFHPWWVVVTFYVACSWTVGLVLAIVFQLAHCVEDVEFLDPTAPRRGNDFALHQLRTTADVACDTPLVGPAAAWLMGGLHHQIEHHLAPGIPHTAYPRMAARVRQVCDDVHLPYHVHRSVWSALHAHARWLKTMGARDSMAPAP